MSLLLQFTVTDQELRRECTVQTASGVKNYLGAKFTFKSGPWVPEETTVVLTNAYGFTYEIGLDENGECIFPEGVMSGSGIVELSLYCNGTMERYHRDSSTREVALNEYQTRITSNIIKFYAYDSGVLGETS